MGFVMMLIGTWKKTSRKVMANQKRNGFSQPVFEPKVSFLPWSMRPAIHQLQIRSALFTLWPIPPSDTYQSEDGECDVKGRLLTP